MDREVLIGNGNMMAGLNHRYVLRELYFPLIGQSNHIGPCGSHLIFGVDNKFASTRDESFRIRIKYLRETLCSSVSLANNPLQIVCHCCDVIDFQMPIFVRKIKIRNLADFTRTISICQHQDFRISNRGLITKAYFDHHVQRVVHHAGWRFLSAGFRDKQQPIITSFSFKIPEDFGDSLESPPESPDGSQTQSFIQTIVELGGFQEKDIYLVILAGDSEDELAKAGETLDRIGPEELISRTTAYWRLWSTGTDINFGHLPPRAVDLFKRSLLTLRAHINSNGSIITDFHPERPDAPAQAFGRLLPAAFAAHALDLAGMPEPAKWFYHALGKLDQTNVLPEAYTPDAASIDPSDESPADPRNMQIPRFVGSAVAIWAIWQHFFRYRDIEFIRPLWYRLICSQADFLASAINPITSLPPPAPGLWNQRNDIDIFTASAFYGGLLAARNFAICFGDQNRTQQYKTQAENLKNAIETNFFSQELQRFVRAVTIKSRNTIAHDHAWDACILSLVRFGVIKPDDPRILATINGLSDKLWVKTPIGGLARFEDDSIDHNRSGIPGRPWIGPTLWLADFMIARTKQLHDLKQTLPLFEWVLANAGGTGLIGESLDPMGQNSPDFKPCLWAHAEFIIAVSNYLEKLEQLHGCSFCGQPIYRMRRPSPAQVRLQDILDRYSEPPSAEPQTNTMVTFIHDGQQATMTIDSRECIGCGVCTVNCSQNILLVTHDKAHIDNAQVINCDLCMQCTESCPVQAIKIISSESGTTNYAG